MTLEETEDVLVRPGVAELIHDAFESPCVCLEPLYVPDIEIGVNPRIHDLRLVDYADDLVMTCEVWEKPRGVPGDASPLGGKGSRRREAVGSLSSS